MSKMSKTAILAFAFGAPNHIDPNNAIGVRAIYLALKCKADIFSQNDVPVGSSANYAENYFPKKKYISTLDIIKNFAAETMRETKEASYQKVIIVAAPQHRQRCYRDLKKVLKKKGIEIGCIEMDDEEDFETVWYDKNSTQWWTRSWWQWWLREIPLRLLPWWLYKKIA
ncbi:MAG: hypothetical protein M1170_01790 [Patescibacteria group bacterium]|nr:hypothetical protein [Patescibacteria group bacterium]